MGGAAPAAGEDCWLLGKGMDAGGGGAEVRRCGDTDVCDCGVRGELGGWI